MTITELLKEAQWYAEQIKDEMPDCKVEVFTNAVRVDWLGFSLEFELDLVHTPEGDPKCCPVARFGMSSSLCGSPEHSLKLARGVVCMAEWGHEFNRNFATEMMEL